MIRNSHPPPLPMTDSNPQSHVNAQKFFDHIADDYTARSQGDVFNVSSLSFSRRQDIVTRQMLETPEGGTVLDYGMGPAVFGPAATKHGLRYIGLDISPKMVALAEAQRLPNAEYHVGDLSLLDSFVQSADTVLLIGLIDYLQEPDAGLRKLARAVKPGGRIVLSFRNHLSIPRLLRNGAKAAWRALRSSSVDRTTAFEAPVLENSFVPKRDFIPLLREEGFTKFRIEYLDCSPVFWNMSLPRPLWNAWKRIDELLSCGALSWMCASGALVAYDKR